MKFLNTYPKFYSTGFYMKALAADPKCLIASRIDEWLERCSNLFWIEVPE